MTHGQKVAKRARARAAAGARFTQCVCGYAHMVAVCPKCQAKAAQAEKAARKPPQHYEDRHQERLFDWIKLARGADPDLGKLYHVPNGGARNEREGGRLKAQGVRKGQLDLNLDVGRGGYFGLRIELKATAAELGRKPVVSPEQQAIIDELGMDNYRVAVCEGWEAARALLLEYVRLDSTIGGETH